MAAEVRRIVKLANPSSSKSAADLLGALARLAMFADSEGREGTAKVWLAEEMIERYIDVGCPGVSPASKSNYRSRLRRLRTATFGPDITTGAPKRLPGSAASTPYTTAEMTALWSWAGCAFHVRRLPASCNARSNLIGAKHAQALPYGSDEWVRVRVYFTLRNSIESFNGFAKDDNYEAIERGGRRRIREPSPPPSTAASRQQTAQQLEPTGYMNDEDLPEAA